MGLTSRELKVRVREHVRDIVSAKDVADVATLRPIPRHFKKFHNCNPKDFKVKGIDKIHIGMRGGNINQRLAQYESKWIWRLNMLQPNGLNENLSFAPLL